MANQLFTAAREKFLTGAIDWASDDIKVALIDLDDYSPTIGTDEFLDDVAGGAIVATSANLSGKTTTGGVADANDVTLSAVSGDISEAILIYKDTGDPTTSPLIALIDDAVGLPVTPTGGDIFIAWDNGADKIFRI